MNPEIVGIVIVGVLAAAAGWSLPWAIVETYRWHRGQRAGGGHMVIRRKDDYSITVNAVGELTRWYTIDNGRKTKTLYSSDFWEPVPDLKSPPEPEWEDCTDEVRLKKNGAELEIGLAVPRETIVLPPGYRCRWENNRLRLEEMARFRE